MILLALVLAAQIAEAWLKARSPDVQRFALQNVTFARIGRSNPAIVVLPDRTIVEPRTEQDR